MICKSLWKLKELVLPLCGVDRVQPAQALRGPVRDSQAHDQPSGQC
jgi:hypothetical protein